MKRITGVSSHGSRACRRKSSAPKFIEIVRLLKKQHLIDAVGVQGHAFETRADVPMKTQRANLNLLAATRLPIYITELDIDGPTDEVQLADYQRIFPMFWEHPTVRGITLWGFRPGHWRTAQGAYLVLKNGAERPAMVWLRNYVMSHCERDTLPSRYEDSRPLGQPAGSVH